MMDFRVIFRLRNTENSLLGTVRELFGVMRGTTFKVHFYKILTSRKYEPFANSAR